MSDVVGNGFSGDVGLTIQVEKCIKKEGLVPSFEEFEYELRFTSSYSP